MKKITAVLACVDIALVIMLCMGYPQKWFRQPPENMNSSNTYYNTSESSSQESSVPPAAAAAEATYYIVREYQGHIGIFQENSRIPYEEIQVSLTLLPEADRLLLHEGIRVNDAESLQKIIEDYES